MSKRLEVFPKSRLLFISLFYDCVILLIMIIYELYLYGLQQDCKIITQ